MGILAMIAGLALLIVIHEFGHWIVARLLGFQTPVFSIGFGKPYLVIGRWWNTEFRITPWLLGGYVAVPELGDESTAREAMKANGIDTTGYVYKHFAIWKRAAVAIAGVTMNVLFAIALTFALFATVGKPYAHITDVFVSEVSDTNTIARDAGIQPNDVIVAVDGQPVSTPDELVRLVSPHKGTPVVITIKRPGVPADIDITLTPNADGRIGIGIGAHQERRFETMSVGEAALEAPRFNADMLGRMVVGIGMMLKIVPAPDNLPEGATDVHGVVAIVQIGAQAFNDGVYSFAMILVLISLNLAIMNILPIPVLDGGYLLLLGIEKLRGKPLDKEVQGRIFFLFFLLLIGLMLFGLFNDIFRPVNFGR